MAIDVKKFYERVGSLNALAEKVGTREIELKSKKKITVRPVVSGIETIIGSAIPRPTPPMKQNAKGEDEPDLTDGEYVSLLEIRNEVVRAGLVAYAITDYTHNGGTFDNPGGDRSETRPRWIRDAAVDIVNSMHADDIAQVLNASDALGRGDPIRLAEDAGKGSGPASKKPPKAGPNEG